MSFLKSNYIFFIWGVIYLGVLLAICHEEPTAFFVLLGIEIVSLIIAFSPVGEWLLRLTTRARKIKTNKDKEYLMPLFEEVYKNAIEQKPKISRNIKLFIDKSKEPNAYAIGSNTIAVTRGAIETLSEEELKGVMAHEFGHLYNGDTKVELVMIVGNGAISLLLLVFKLFLRVFDRDIFFLLIAINAIFTFIIQAFLSIGRRKNEYMADRFAYDIGYGAELIDSLYLFQELQAEDKRKFWERLTSSHPDLENRIAKLENINNDYQIA